jgi:hypothetical protein
MRNWSGLAVLALALTGNTYAQGPADPCRDHEGDFRKVAIDLFRSWGISVSDDNLDTGNGFTTSNGTHGIVLRGYVISNSGDVSALMSIGECDPTTGRYKELASSGSGAGLQAVCPGSHDAYCPPQSGLTGTYKGTIMFSYSDGASSTEEVTISLANDVIGTYVGGALRSQSLGTAIMNGAAAGNDLRGATIYFPDNHGPYSAWCEVKFTGNLTALADKRELAGVFASTPETTTCLGKTIVIGIDVRK